MSGMIELKIKLSSGIEILKNVYGEFFQKREMEAKFKAEIEVIEDHISKLNEFFKDEKNQSRISKEKFIEKELKNLEKLKKLCINSLDSPELVEQIDNVIEYIKNNSTNRIEIIKNINSIEVGVEFRIKDIKAKKDKEKEIEDSILSNGIEDMSVEEAMMMSSYNKLKEMKMDIIIDKENNTIVGEKEGGKQVILNIKNDSIKFDFVNYTGKECIKDMKNFEKVFSDHFEKTFTKFHTVNEDKKIKKNIKKIKENIYDTKILETYVKEKEIF